MTRENDAALEDGDRDDAPDRVAAGSDGVGRDLRLGPGHRVEIGSGDRRAEREIARGDDNFTRWAELARPAVERGEILGHDDGREGGDGDRRAGRDDRPRRSAHDFPFQNLRLAAVRDGEAPGEVETEATSG